jgi:cyanophycinase
MPAPVPSGYTRGSIQFIGACQDGQREQELFQRFWEESGAYGARIVLLSADDESAPIADRCTALFNEWESDSVNLLTVESRQSALHPANLDRIEGATGILILGANPLKLASFLGGTPLAQTIRRANARGKTIGGYGPAAALLCEHMIAFESGAEEQLPFLRRHAVQFAPGLGITNRIVLDTTPSDPGDGWNRLSRLLCAVAYNPFLLGVGLETDTGAAIYADNTLEIFGQNSALVVDAAEMSYTDVHEFRRSTPLSLLGVKLHVLGPKYTFDLNDRTPHPPGESDIPDRAVPEGD